MWLRNLLLKILEWLSAPVQTTKYVPPMPEPIVESIPEVPVETPPEAPKPTLGELLYAEAKKCIDIDIAKTQNEFGCAEAVSYLIRRTFGETINTVSTIALYVYLRDSKKWQKVTEPLPGDIIISPTGMGNGKIKNGHVGIYGKTHIMSNDSIKFTWQPNFTLTSWKKYYQQKGGYPVLFYRRIVV